MRRSYIDYMKALGALLVILAHSISYYSVSYKLVSRPIGICGNLCYAVNAAVFFVIAGLLCHKQNVGSYYLKKVKRILIPFVFFTALKIAYTLFISDQYAHSETLKGVLIDAFVYGRLYWFPYTIFVIFLITPLFWSRKDDGKARRIWVPAVLFTAFLITDIILSARHLENSILYLQINNVLIYLPFFLFGMLIGGYGIDKVESLLTSRMLIKTIVSLVIIGLSAFYLVYGMGDGDEVKVMWEQPYLLRFLIALPLIYILFAVSYKLPGGIAPLKLAGEFSLQIMLFDSIFRVVIFELFEKVIEHGEWMIPVVTVVSISLSVLTSYIIRKIPVVRTVFGL